MSRFTYTIQKQHIRKTMKRLEKIAHVFGRVICPDNSTPIDLFYLDVLKNRSEDGRVGREDALKDLELRVLGLHYDVSVGVPHRALDNALVADDLPGVLFLCAARRGAGSATRSPITRLCFKFGG